MLEKNVVAFLVNDPIEDVNARAEFIVASLAVRLLEKILVAGDDVVDVNDREEVHLLLATQGQSQQLNLVCLGW